MGALLMAGAVQAQEPDAAAQNRAWGKCKACHATDANASRNEGPTLFGIIGAPAGIVADFKSFSPAMKNSGVVWSEEALDKFIAKPHTFMPGNTMPFSGMPREADRKAVIAYLKSHNGLKK